MRVSYLVRKFAVSVVQPASRYGGIRVSRRSSGGRRLCLRLLNRAGAGARARAGARAGAGTGAGPGVRARAGSRAGAEAGAGAGAGVGAGADPDGAAEAAVVDAVGSELDLEAAGGRIGRSLGAGVVDVPLAAPCHDQVVSLAELKRAAAQTHYRSPVVRLRKRCCYMLSYKDGKITSFPDYKYIFDGQRTLYVDQWFFQIAQDILQKHS